MNPVFSRIELIITVVAAAALCVVLCWHFAQFVSALRPRRRTLEWIFMAEKQPFSAACGTADYRWRDYLLMLVPVIIGVANSMLLLLRILPIPSYQTADLFTKISLWLVNAACPAMSVLAVYWASKRIASSSAIAFMAAIPAALDVSSDVTALAFWLVSFAFFIRLWGRRNADFWSSAADLLMLTAFLALGTYFRITTVFLAAVLYVAFVFRCVVLRKDCAVVRTVLALLAFVLLYAAWYLLASIPMAMAQTGLKLPQMLFGKEFWQCVGQNLQQLFLQLRTIPVLHMLFSFGPLHWYGVFCLAACLYAAICCRDYDGLLLAWIGVCAFALTLAGLAPAGFFALILCSYVWKHFFARGRRKTAVLFYAGLLFLMIAANLVLLFSI